MIAIVGREAAMHRRRPETGGILHRPRSNGLVNPGSPPLQQRAAEVPHHILLTRLTGEIFDGRLEGRSLPARVSFGHRLYLLVTPQGGRPACP